jgi:hypothetical protein
MPNTCWECKNHILKLNVLVPYNHTIKEYVHRTGNFQSNIVAVVKKTEGQYTVWFRSEGQMEEVTFKMQHTCKLRIQKSSQDACPCYRKTEQSQINSITYSRLPLPGAESEPQERHIPALNTNSMEPLSYAGMACIPSRTEESKKKRSMG